VHYIKYLFPIILIITSNISKAENFSSIRISKENTCISSNGIPDHNHGSFPNRANPNTLREQNLIFCFPTNPQLTENITWGLMTVGVSLSGIPIRPYTAGYFDITGRNGYSRDPSSGWRRQAMFDPLSLGIDEQNGHVDRSGLYHYHGLEKKFRTLKEEVLIGYAPDGFKIIYSPDKATSSWQLKPGLRLSQPGGSHNGQFEEDFEYLPNSGTLDECNGTMISGRYTYFATKSYPFFPRCFRGNVNSYFLKRD
tara:strand:+ start:620 stop:1378 length:759 start_codon:yes stop_codon:yes gene_type:complete